MAKRIKDVATQLECSTQTIRNYLKIGDQFFSERATAKTRKRFDDGDIRQLQTIKSLLDDGLTYDQIPDRLTPAPRVVDVGHEPDPNPEPPPEDAPPTTSALAKRYEQTIAAQQQTIVLQNDYIDHLKSENERLRSELDDARLPWWRRIFGNSPE